MNNTNKIKTLSCRPNKVPNMVAFFRRISLAGSVDQGRFIMERTICQGISPSTIHHFKGSLIMHGGQLVAKAHLLVQHHMVLVPCPDSSSANAFCSSCNFRLFSRVSLHKSCCILEMDCNQGYGSLFINPASSEKL